MSAKITPYLRECVNDYCREYGLPRIIDSERAERKRNLAENAYVSARNHPDRNWTARLIAAYEYWAGLPSSQEDFPGTYATSADEVKSWTKQP